LITTQGFRDILEIGRQRRPHLYDLQADKRPLIVPRSRRYEVAERVDANGGIVTPLDKNEVAALIHRIEKEGEATSFVVAFLHSYINPAHELEVRDVICSIMPESFVSVSSEVSGQFREYERLVATALNAFVGPVMSRYLGRLESKVTQAGVGHLYINQSNGGIISIGEACRFPVYTALSGPSAMVVGTKFLTQHTKDTNVIAIDIGGTSADISVIESGEAAISSDREIGGYPVRIPALDIATIGAGGGSIAWIDSGGMLKVGPQSAGASPGPACYGLGGSDATVTDARVVLGHLNREVLLGGRLPIDYQKSLDAVETLATVLSLPVIDTAQGIIDIANGNLIRAIRKATIERGYNPEEFVLVPCGGAGPLHASELGRELNVRKILVPKHPGILAAQGLLAEDFRKDFIETRVSELNQASMEDVRARFSEMLDKATEWFTAEAIAPEDRVIAYALDMRYQGQNYEIRVPFSETTTRTVSDLAARFHQEYRRLYGYVAENDPIQIVHFNLTATGKIPQPMLPSYPNTSVDASGAAVGSREAFFPGCGAIACRVFDRDRLSAGNVLAGPAVVEQMDTTTLVLEGQECRVDSFLDLVIEDKKQ
jgi:N-methylhydantoinase A